MLRARFDVIRFARDSLKSPPLFTSIFTLAPTHPVTGANFCVASRFLPVPSCVFQAGIMATFLGSKGLVDFDQRSLASKLNFLIP